ncbi:hypothetical protein ONA91_38525 [Micromonospora sp. DR5-3]|uniref:hypothetical protein n=1 Tax=unclassified Micromonospora TaxID=2617518 RepID=UPI0011D891EB|nr:MULTISPECIES: hypothetical protein [unclassified Micromonospora]MCW3820343.1 hypothetical protein [Micromonospora sp. DR5-3]TYC19410.1 hypothetical protein FXF52_36730 [Micromonospora sp. MP36]
MTTPDQLAVWQRLRDTVGWRDVVPHLKAPVSAIRDGFVGFARKSAGRDPQRLGRFLAAYDDVRLEAAAGTDLTSGLLARWNRIIRGVPVAAFRRAPAHAKSGRERYGLHADTEQRFASVAEAADRETPVTARAYLDVAFFHPYGDGNARLAGVVFQFVLLRESVELDEVAPIRTTVRRADDAGGAADLARLVHGIAAATHRRWLRANR